MDENLSKDLLATAISTIKKSGGLPEAGDDYEYYTNFPGYKTFCCRLGSRINKLIGRVLQFEEVLIKWPPVDREALAGQELVDEQFDSLVEANDILLERISNYLDNVTSDKKDFSISSTTEAVETSVASWNAKKKSKSMMLKQGHENVPRPQTKFKDMVDNSKEPFIPLIREKPNSLRPLPAVYAELQKPTTLQSLIENARKWAESPDRFTHPYQHEIEVFEVLNEQLELSEPQEYKSLEDTSLVTVTTLEGLKQLLFDLKSTREIAIDLEAHTYRSFQGFVCLMQLSTRTTDYIVDTLELREHMYLFNEVFTDPKIIKVMHGADWDIPWLQRDFGLYIVNLFDTGQASRTLGLPRYSLSFLLSYCCKVNVDKKYQLADWRIRPLPSDMIKYAREDTHYLLYIYDRLRNELLRRSNSQSNLMRVVIDNSRSISLKQYQKPLYHEDDYLKLCKKFKRPLMPQQLSCLKLLYKWRYDLARREDESIGYILPNHMMFQLAEILPREVEGIIACCTPVPTLLRQQVQEVHRLIQTARNSTADTVQSTSVSSTVQEPVAADDNEMDTSVATDATSTDTSNIVITGPSVAVKPVTIDFKNKTVAICQPAKDIFSRLQEGFKQMLSIYRKPLTTSPNVDIMSKIITKAAVTPVHATPTSTPPIIATPPAESATPTTVGKKRKTLQEEEGEVSNKMEQEEGEIDSDENDLIIIEEESFDEPKLFKKPKMEEEIEIGEEEKIVSAKKFRKRGQKRKRPKGGAAAPNTKKGKIPPDFKSFDYNSVDFSSVAAQETPTVVPFKPARGGILVRAPRPQARKKSSQKSVTFKRRRNK